MIHYEVNKVKYNSQYEFGISAFDSKGRLVKSVDSITSNINDMLLLASLCNAIGLELCHLDDVIEDYLTDFQI